MFDKADARLAAKAAVVVVAGSSLLLTASTVLGLAWRIFVHLAAG